MGFLSVPGADLYYEVSGSGPVLLLVPGGTDDARDFAGIRPLLQGAFTVVTYDCRGVSRSGLRGPARDVHVETQADDAWRLLRAVGEGPAHVFGTSSGGQVGLALAARHPGAVDTLVAHEPPVVRLLAEGDPRRDAMSGVFDIYQERGVGPAMEAFVSGAGLRTVGDPATHAPESPRAAVLSQERAVRMSGNLDYFLSRVIRHVVTYLPDVEALRRFGTRVVIGVGGTSRGQLANDAGLALAERLGNAAKVFPGGHAGFVTHPVGFAERLHRVLGTDR